MFTCVDSSQNEFKLKLLKFRNKFSLESVNIKELYSLENDHIFCFLRISLIIHLINLSFSLKFI